MSLKMAVISFLKFCRETERDFNKLSHFQSVKEKIDELFIFPDFDYDTLPVPAELIPQDPNSPDFSLIEEIGNKLMRCDKEDLKLSVLYAFHSQADQDTPEVRAQMLFKLDSAILLGEYIQADTLTVPLVKLFAELDTENKFVTHKVFNLQRVRRIVESGTVYGPLYHELAMDYAKSQASPVQVYEDLVRDLEPLDAKSQSRLFYKNILSVLV